MTGISWKNLSGRITGPSFSNSALQASSRRL
jgi:hypothetical protein